MQQPSCCKTVARQTALSPSQQIHQVSLQLDGVEEVPRKKVHKEHCLSSPLETCMLSTRPTCAREVGTGDCSQVRSKNFQQVSTALKAHCFSVPEFWSTQVNSTCQNVSIYYNIDTVLYTKAAYCFPCKVTRPFHTGEKTLAGPVSVLDVAPLFPSLFLQHLPYLFHTCLTIDLFELVAFVAVAIALLITIVVAGRGSAALFRKLIY